MIVPFSPPDINEDDVESVAEVLRSGWITTGPKTAEFEEALAAYCAAERVKCLSSATAALELSLRLFGIGEGDEVLTSPMSFAASANVILHVGAKPVFADLDEGSFLISAKEIEKKLSARSRAVIAVDYGGMLCDYSTIYELLKVCGFDGGGSSRYLNELSRPLLLADSAHALGSRSNKGESAGSLADMSAFSFHAVKNLTTAEGGALSFSGFDFLSADDIYKGLSLLSLHGQSKDALSKMKAGNWRYSIETAGYKANMTDIQAALGLSQLKRYDKTLAKRRRLCRLYDEHLRDDERILSYSESYDRLSAHLYPVRINGADEKQRDIIIEKMKERGVSVNVHFIPLPMQPLYRRLGYSVEDCPNAFAMYENLVTLPLFSKMTDDELEYTSTSLKSVLDSLGV